MRWALTITFALGMIAGMATMAVWPSWYARVFAVAVWSLAFAAGVYRIGRK